MMSSSKNAVLAQAVGDLAALLDFAGRHREAEGLRGEITSLSAGRARGLEALGQLNRIRGGMHTLRQTALAPEARSAADDVVSRLSRVLSS